MNPPRSESPARPRPAEVIRRAEAEAAAAQATVEARSRARLDVLLRAAPIDRLAGLDDHDLVPADRVRLRRSLQASLRRPLHQHLVPRRTFALLGRGAARLRGPVIRILIGICVVAFLGAVAANHSASPATLTGPTAVTLLRPNGTQIAGTLPAGTTLLVQRRDADWAQAREWRARQGYLSFTVPLARLRFAR